MMIEKLPTDARPAAPLIEPGVQPGLLRQTVNWLEDRAELERQRLAADVEAGDQYLQDVLYNTDLHAIEWWRARAVKKAASFAGRAAMRTARADRREEQTGTISTLLKVTHRGLARYFGWRARSHERSVPFYDQQLEELELSRYEE
jgi:hypothetical protein